MNHPSFALRKNSWEDEGVTQEEEDDEIIREVRKARQRLLDEAGDDLHELVERLKRRQSERGLPLVQYPPRRPQGWKEDPPPPPSDPAEPH